MLYMRLPDTLKAVTLYQFDNPPEPGLHIRWQEFKFFSNAVVEQFYDPRHHLRILHFCNIHNWKIFLVSVLSMNRSAVGRAALYAPRCSKSYLPQSAQ